MFRLVLFTVCVAAACAAVEWSKPAFCKSNDCPVFDTIDVGSGYEVRRYQPAKWVSTMFTARTDEEADEKSSIAFNKLFQYIDGGNERGEKIAMTTPVTTKVEPSSSPMVESTYTRSFYIPYSVQEDAPKPSSSDVFLQDAPQQTVYVRSFSGFASQQDYLDNAVALAEAVRDDSLETDFYYRAGYDSPNTFYNRHNEAWLVVKPALKPANKLVAKHTNKQ